MNRVAINGRVAIAIGMAAASLCCGHLRGLIGYDYNARFVFSHPNPMRKIKGVAVGAQDQWLAIVADDRSLMYRTGSAAPDRVDGIMGFRRYFVTCPDAQLDCFVTGRDGPTPQLWDNSTGTPQLIREFRGLTNYARLLAIDRDARWLAALGGSEEGKIAIWRLRTGELLRFIEPERSLWTDDLLFTSDGAGRAILVRGVSEGGLEGWDIESGEMVLNVSYDLQSAAAVGHGRVAMGSHTGDLALYEVETGGVRELFSGGGPRTGIQEIVLNVSSNTLLTIHFKGKLGVYDLTTDKIVYREDSPPIEAGFGVSMNRSGGFLVSDFRKIWAIVPKEEAVPPILQQVRDNPQAMQSETRTPVYAKREGTDARARFTKRMDGDVKRERMQAGAG